MANTTLINVTACDNELYLIASTPAGSSEICHLKSGYGDPVSYKVNPHSILPAGAYTLIMVGINWGGPLAFKVAVTAGTTTTYQSPPPAGSPVGAIWTQAVPMTV